MSKKIIVNCLSIAVTALTIWLSIRFLLPIALPFLLGLWLALAAEPAVRLLCSRGRLPRCAGSAIGVTAVFSLTVAIVILLCGVLMRQLRSLQNVLPELETAVTQGLELIRQWLRALTQRLPDRARTALDQLTQRDLLDGGQLSRQIADSLPKAAKATVSWLSSGVFGLLTGMIAAYMISGRLPQFREKLRSLLPDTWKRRYAPALKGLRRALGGWCLAQLKLAGVAFLFLLTGLWLLRIEGCFMLSLLITIVDAFPVLGVGTVLLPWSLVCMLQGNLARGLGLLGLYAAIWLTRSVLEPKLIGKSLGLDPLLTLFTIYAGWQLLGIAGMLLSPILTMAAVHVLRAAKASA